MLTRFSGRSTAAELLRYLRQKETDDENDREENCVLGAVVPRSGDDACRHPGRAEGASETARHRDGLHGNDLHVTILRVRVPVAHCRSLQRRGLDCQRVSHRAFVTHSCRNSSDNNPLLRTSQGSSAEGHVLRQQIPATAACVRGLGTLWRYRQSVPVDPGLSVDQVPLSGDLTGTDPVP